MPGIIISTVDGAWGRSTIFDSNVSEENLKNEKSMPVQLSLDKIEEAKDEEIEEEEEEERPLSQEETLEAEPVTLPYLLSSLFGTILEDTITQLRILSEGSNEIKILKVKSDWNKFLTIKYGVEQPTIIDELEGIDPKKLNCYEYKINKLDTDKKYISKIISSVFSELTKDKSFKFLTDCVNTIVAKENYRVSLIEDEAKNKTLRHELSKQLRQLRTHIIAVNYDADARIAELKSQVEDSGLNAHIRDRYIENWQRARAEQHNKTIENTESKYTDVIEYYKIRTDHEHRVHMEVEMLTKVAINDILDKIDKMMTKYDEDMEQIELKIQFKKNDYQLMLEKRILLEKTLAQHEKLMKAWIAFKDEREKARAYREKMTNSAIMVQAWWRGLLVRLQMGPYRVKKKPTGKKK